MKRGIVRIDEDKCNGCGLCIDACHEGALEIVDGKAKLVSESDRDGLGDCLPECPTGAISIEERVAEAYDEEAVKARIAKSKQPNEAPLACGCPGTQTRTLAGKASAYTEDTIELQLAQWPCQLRLIPVNAPYLDKAHLLIAADCTAFAYADIHRKFIRNKVTMIGCPKLDNTDYSAKLTAILKQHDIKSITILKMQVPCCGGLVHAVKNALINSGKMIPWSVNTVSVDGQIIEE